MELLFTIITLVSIFLLVWIYTVFIDKFKLEWFTKKDYHNLKFKILMDKNNIYYIKFKYKIFWIRYNHKMHRDNRCYNRDRYAHIEEAKTHISDIKQYISSHISKMDRIRKEKSDRKKYNKRARTKIYTIEDLKNTNE